MTNPAEWHITEDAQGPCGIFDTEGRCIVMATSTFVPTKGFVGDELPRTEGWADERNANLRYILRLVQEDQTQLRFAEDQRARNRADNFDR